MASTLSPGPWSQSISRVRAKKGFRFSQIKLVLDRIHRSQCYAVEWQILHKKWTQQHWGVHRNRIVMKILFLGWNFDMKLRQVSRWYDGINDPPIWYLDSHLISRFQIRRNPYFDQALIVQ